MNSLEHVLKSMTNLVHQRTDAIKKKKTVYSPPKLPHADHLTLPPKNRSAEAGPEMSQSKLLGLRAKLNALSRVIFFWRKRSS